MGIKTVSYAASDVGKVRSSNQDSGYAGVNLFFVADGMGGHAGGDIASAITAHRRLGLGALVVGIDLNCTHHKSARDGIVTGVAHMVSAGNTMLCSEIVITNSQGERICTSRLTAMARKPRP